MATVTFDTLELTKLLKNAKLEQEQAEAIVQAISKAQEGIVSKEYVEGKFNLMYWMISANTAMLMLLIGKVFFTH
jgi:hypothetical protein